MGGRNELLCHQLTKRRLPQSNPKTVSCHRSKIKPRRLAAPKQKGAPGTDPRTESPSSCLDLWGRWLGLTTSPQEGAPGWLTRSEAEPSSSAQSVHSEDRDIK